MSNKYVVLCIHNDVIVNLLGPYKDEDTVCAVAKKIEPIFDGDVFVSTVSEYYQATLGVPVDGRG